MRSSRKIGLLFLLLLGALAAACGTDDAAPLLYRIGDSSYLLGTIHVGVRARGDLPTSVWQRFDASARFGAEAEIRQIDSAEYEALAQLPAGSDGLDVLLGSSAWGKLVALLGSGVSWTKLARLRPWAVSSIVYHTLIPDPSIEGMDRTLLDAADGADKPLFFLEAWQDQVTALNAEPLDDDVASLLWLLDNGAVVSTRLRELIAAYRAGNADEVWRLAPQAGAVATPGSPSFETFITQRNRRWLPTIEQELATGGAFMAVGFGHLYGQDGLLARLQAAGHAVERVP